MKKVLFSLLLAGVLTPAFADDLVVERVGVHLTSWHSKPGYNNTNPGMYVRLSNGLVMGAYRNSLEKTSAYIGAHFDAALSEHVNAGLTVGVVNGYPGNKWRIGRDVVPLFVPSLALDIGRSVSVRISLIPNVAGINDVSVVHLSLERRF